MANKYLDILNITANGKNQMGLSNTIKRDYGIPLDFTSVQESFDAAIVYAATSTLAYVGQTVAVGAKLYIISDVANGTHTVGEGEAAKTYDNYLAEVGSKTAGDGSTIELDGQTLKLAGLTGLDNAKTYVPSLINGKLVWAEPDTSTAEGQAQEINGLKTRTAALEATVNGTGEGDEHVAGLVEKVAALEAVDNATQAELDAYKDVVTAAIAAGVKEAKDYADENDANTEYNDAELRGRIETIEADYLKEEDKYDDTALAARVKAIEDDYLKGADKYDDTALAGRVTTAEGKIADLEAAVEAIDYVDADELATELASYAKTEDVNTALADKANKTALEAVESKIDTFLTGTGATDALDSLQELITYINEHDDVELADIIADVETLQTKVDTGDQKVSEYVTAIIDALKIGDYAKVADLTALAGRVEALEAKPFSTYATKTEVEAVDARFADYTKTSDLTTQLAAKADADSVVANDTFNAFKTENTTAIATAKSEAIAAAKTETETQVEGLASTVTATYATKAELETHKEDIADDLLAYAKTADVNAELAKKIETAQITHTTTGVTEGVTKEGTTLKIVVDAYTKEQVYTKSETDAEITKKITSINGGESAGEVKSELVDYRDALNAEIWGETARSWTTKVESDGKTIVTYTPQYGTTSRIDTLEGSVAAVLAQADKGVADAATAQVKANEAYTQASTNKIDLEALTTQITNRNQLVDQEIANLKAKDTTITGDIAGLKTTTESHSAAIGEHTAAITALQAKDTELTGLISGHAEAVDAKFADYYTAAQVDTKVKEVSDVVGAIDLAPYAKTSDVDSALVLKANATDVYTKEEADAEFMTESEVDARINALVAAADPADGKVITDIQNLVKYVDENAGEIAALVTTVGNHTTAIEKNTGDIATINNTIAAIVQPKASTEISVADDGTLGIKELNVNKLVQTAGDTLILDGGNATGLTE